MKTLTLSIRLFKKNMRSIVLFEAAYRLICIAIFFPVLTAAFQLTLKLAGFHYLSKDRLIPYLTSPFTLAILCLIFLCIIWITVFEIFCIIPAFHASFHHETISTTGMFHYGLVSFRKACRRQNRSLFFFSLILIPLTNITILSGFVSSRTVPDFILYYIRSNMTVFRVVLVLFFCLFLFAAQFALIFHCFCLEPDTLPKARTHSLNLSGKKAIQLLLVLFMWNVFLVLLLLLLSIVLLAVLALFLWVIPTGHVSSANILYLFSCILTVLFDLYMFCNVPITFSCLSAFYYRQKQKKGEPVSGFHEKKLTLRGRFGRRLALVLLLAAGVFNLVYFGLLGEMDFFWNQNIVSDPVITAHRGDSIHAPENTLAAFQYAIDLGADCIELDVRQTKDHVLVVIHDADLKRLTGQKTKIAESTYEELASLDIGSHFSSEFAGTTICTLEEALAFCQGRADLNIELKTSDGDEGLAQDVVSLVTQYDYTDHCVIASQSLASLKQVKQLDSNLKTIYLMPVAYGNFRNLTYIDGFSIKSVYITRKLVNHIHDSGRVIYAWTVNDRDTMEHMYSLGVDCLVTDYPELAREVYYEDTLNPHIATWLRKLVALYKTYLS